MFLVIALAGYSSACRVAVRGIIELVRDDRDILFFQAEFNNITVDM